MNDMPTIELGEYEHYKGNRYQVMGVGRDTETDTYSVVYKPLQHHEGLPDFWVRPYDMFIGTVEVNGEVIPRFKKVA